MELIGTKLKKPSLIISSYRLLAFQTPAVYSMCSLV